MPRCSKKHHVLLHGSNNRYCDGTNGRTRPDAENSRRFPREKGGRVITATTKTPEVTRAPTPGEVRDANEAFALVPVQEVAVKGNGPLIKVFFDAGSNIHLVRREYTERAGWVGTPVRQAMTMAGGSTKEWDTALYSIPLVKNNGTEVRLLATAVDQVTKELARVDVTAAATMFGCRASELLRPSGQVDLLIGIQSAAIFPTVRATRGNLRLLESQFGSGLLLDGAHPAVKPASDAPGKEAFANLVCSATTSTQERSAPKKPQEPLEDWPVVGASRPPCPAADPGPLHLVKAE